MTPTTQSPAEATPSGRSVNKSVAIAAGLLVAFLAVVAVLGLRYFESERTREVRAWETRLGIVADSRVAAAYDWLEGNFNQLAELARNTSVQLYLTELALEDKVADEAAQAAYLRNLLTATAERAGFAPTQAPSGVAANITRTGEAGLALVDRKGRIIAASPGMLPPDGDPIRGAVEKAGKGEKVFIDAFVGPTGQPSLGFALPVLAVQAATGSEIVGILVGVRVMGEDLFRHLKQPGMVLKTSEVHLVRKHEGQAQYLSPLKDGTAPLARALSADSEDLDTAMALRNPGNFVKGTNWEGAPVIAISRSVSGTPWQLVHSVSYAESLGEADVRHRTLVIVFALVVVVLGVALVAVWRHGTSLRAAEAAHRFQVSSERFENLSKFMNLVTNSQPTSIVAVDEDGVYSFANQTAGKEAGVIPDEMLGKTMPAVIGPVKAHAFMEINKEVFKEPRRISKITTFEEDEGEFQVIKSEHIPLHGDRDHKPGVLMILDDITALVKERKRGEERLLQLVNTLVSVVDRRDPYSAYHSSRVAEVSAAIAKEMELDEIGVKTTDISGRLMNLGKIFVPSELLTKAGQLTPEERDMLSRSFLVSSDLLRGVEFDGPVVQTIREIGETWDGKGPLGLGGEQILVTARIVAVANAFVGMVSPRAWRDPMTFEKVADILFKDSGMRYDRRPVLALMHLLDNKGAKESWAHFREPTQEGDGAA